MGLSHTTTRCTGLPTTRRLRRQLRVEVRDLIELMRPHWQGSGAYPGDDPYNHNGFRTRYSDHHPIAFMLTSLIDDDGA